MATAPDIWMPLYIGDYLADTMHLEGPEHGAYLLLIMAYWRNWGPLPDDNKKLAAIARTPLKVWMGMRDTIAEFFEVVDGVWRHWRVEEEMAAAIERVEIGKARTRAATEARRKRNDQRNGQRNGQRNDNESQSQSPSPADQEQEQDPLPEWEKVSSGTTPAHANGEDF